MINDSSSWLHHKYFSLKNRQISIKLKNGRVLNGIIHGFYHGDESWDKHFYWRWYILPNGKKFGLGVDAFGFELGEIINHTDIEKIYFEEDQTEMNFK